MISLALGLFAACFMCTWMLFAYRNRRPARKVTLLFALGTVFATLTIASMAIPEVHLFGTSRSLGDYIGAASVLATAVVFLRF
jgi:hypothetical protein